MYPNHKVSKKLMPVDIGITMEKLPRDSAFMEKNMDMKINPMAPMIFMSNKNQMNSIGLCTL